MNKIELKCPECGATIIVEKNPNKIKYKCKCGCSYGCDLRGDRE